MVSKRNAPLFVFWFGYMLLPALPIALLSKEFPRVAYYSMLSWQLSIFPMMFFQYYLFRALQKPKGRVLFLRRFHLERPPAFPVSRVIDKLGISGFEPVTLADSIVYDDVASKQPLAAFLVMPIFAIGLIVTIVAPLLIGLFSVIAVGALFGEHNTEILLAGLLLGSGAGVLSYIAFFTPLFGGRQGPLNSLSRYIFRSVLKGLPLLRLDLQAADEQRLLSLVSAPLRKPWQLGMVIINCSDENWDVAVELLVRTSRMVLIDISNPSRHILAEIAKIKSNNSPVIWMYPHSFSNAQIEISSEGYQIYGFKFSGQFNSFAYPEPGFDRYEFNKELDRVISEQTKKLVNMLDKV